MRVGCGVAKSFQCGQRREEISEAVESKGKNPFRVANVEKVALGAKSERGRQKA